MAGRPPRSAAQARGIKRATERKAIKKYMGGGGYGTWDKMNEFYARGIMARVKAGNPPKPFYVVYANEVVKRLKLDIDAN